MDLREMKVLNSIGDGVVCIDDNYNIKFVNESAREILSCVNLKSGTTCIFDVLNVITDDNDTFFKTHIDLVFQGNGKKGLINNAYVLTKDGQRQYLSATISKVEDDKLVIINFRDITRLKSYEFNFNNEKKKLETIVQSLPLGVLIIDNERHVHYENPFVRENLKIKREEVPGEKFGATFSCVNSIDSICGISNECENCQIREIIDYAFEKNALESRISTMTRLIEGQPQEFVFSNYYIPLTEEDDRMMVIVQDVTQQKEYEGLLEKAKNEAIEASKLKSEFLANMSHEIRTPLNGIVGMIDITHHQLEDDELRGNMEIAKASSQHLLGLINDVLDYSKLEAKKIQIYKKNFKIGDFLKTIFMENKVKADLKAIDFNYELPEFEYLRYYGDEMRIKQVLTNIIDNAIKFTDFGSVSVVVQIDQMTLNVAVTDTGVGIPEDVDDLFESFTQVDASYTRDKGGTGLGLAISNQLVGLMAGKIGYTSTVGKGTVFTIEVPLEAEHLDKNYEVIEEQGSEKSLNILLAEDDIVNQIVLQRKLEMFNYKVDIASTGKQAVDLFHKKVYDLVILDIQLPELNGMEVVDIIREDIRNGKVPVIALTAHALISEREEIMAHEFDIYMSKPVDFDYLSKVVTTLTDATSDEDVCLKELDFNMIHNQLDFMEECIETSSYVVLEKGVDLLKNYFEDKNYSKVKEILFKMALELRKEKYETLRTHFEKLKKELTGIQGGEEC